MMSTVDRSEEAEKADKAVRRGWVGIVMDIDITLLFQLGLFLLVLVLLNWILLKPLMAVMERRHEKLYGIRDHIEQLQRDTAADLAVYQGRLREARDLAQQERESLVAAGREEERRMLTEARNEISRALNDARVDITKAELEAKASLGRDTEDLARRLVSKVLGREVGT